MDTLKEQLVAVVGGVASGKSALVAALKLQLPHYEVIAIDSYRKAHNAPAAGATLEGEKKAMQALMADLAVAPFAILETSGASKYFEAMLHQARSRDRRVLVVKLNCPQSLALERREAREREPGYEPTPFPYKNSLEQGMAYINKVLETLPADIELDGTQPTAVLVQELLDLAGLRAQSKWIHVDSVVRQINLIENTSTRFSIDFIRAATGGIRSVTAIRYRPKKKQKRRAPAPHAATGGGTWKNRFLLKIRVENPQGDFEPRTIRIQNILRFDGCWVEHKGATYYKRMPLPRG